MSKYLILGLGGAVGTILRYIMGGLDQRFPGRIFPISTLVINVTGSLAIGLLWGTLDRFAFSPNARLFLFIGVLGGYTTFSTFSLETFKLIRNGEYGIALINIFLSFTLGVAAVFLGCFLSKAVLGLRK